MHAKKSAQQPPEVLVVGRVVRPHGVRGELIVEALSPMIGALAAGTVILLGDPLEQMTIRQIRPHRKRYLVTLSGCSSREQADHFRGLKLAIPFDQAEPLPEGEFYYWQILGLRVMTNEGEFLGEIVDILETGANDVYIVRDAQGVEQLIPAIAPVIKRVDLEEGVVHIELIPGLLND
jgi:16S rRNA processing protein RimM